LRGRSFKTQSDIDRQDVPSHGRSRKVLGVKTDRLHHLLSDLEYGYLLVSEFSPDVVDKAATTKSASRLKLLN